MTVRPPLVGAALWSAVMKAAEDRCECRGACGKKHDPDRTRKQQRCDVRNGDHVSRVGLIVLIAMPRDPINERDFATAAQLPAKRLAAMCRPCRDAVLSKIRRAAKKLPMGDGLFDVEEFRVAPPTAGAA
ncbi:hypothetical protein OG749_36070 [Streptomyces nojiriensis]|uniref:hypothetical protein n=1 Tax=Streptomyces nojiriensis TaxID=66374 RepID=UPI002E17875A